MASSIVQTALAFILSAIICCTTRANPIPTPDPLETYNVYFELVCETERLWRWEGKLRDDFKTNRFPNTNGVKIVDVPNLLLTNDMTYSARINTNEIDLLSAHRNYLLHYQYIIDYVLADEENTTSSTDFISETTDIRRFIRRTVTELENVMIHLGHLTRAQQEILEASRPYFNPQWERNVIDRYERDLYVLDQMKNHLLKSYQDFSSYMTRRTPESDPQMECPYVLP